MKIKELSAILLVIVFIAGVLPVTAIIAGAYGAEDGRLTVTHANVSGSYEGSAIIYTPQAGKSIGSFGTFEWWSVVVFEWDSELSVYKVISVDTTSGKSKADTQIPENGFVYAACVGNNWPALYAQDPTQYSAYKDHPNYINEPVKASYSLISQLKSGDSIYCYGGDFINGSIKTNGELWYTSDFVSETYISTTPVAGAKAFNPDETEREKTVYTIGINSINVAQAEGYSTIYTDAWGNSIREKNQSDFAWMRVVVFEWDDLEQAYIISSISTAASSTSPKNAIIPKNGFVLAINSGNDYSGTGGINYKNKIATEAYACVPFLSVGDKAYLSGVNLENGTIQTNNQAYYSSNFSSSAFVTINAIPDAELVTPDTTLQRLSAPVLSQNNSIVPEGELLLEWTADERAENTTIYLFDSSMVSNGPLVMTKRVDGNELTLTSAELETGHTYRVLAVSNAEGYRASRHTYYEFYVVKLSALDSVFNDKTVVAFGDSLTAFTGWVAMMKAEIGCEVINAGVGGNTTAHAVARIENDVIDKNPDLVIMNFGMNDAAVQISSGENLTKLETYKKNMGDMIAAIQNSGAVVVLVTPHAVCTAANYYNAGGYGLNYAGDNYGEFVQAVKELAVEYNTGLVDIYALSGQENATDFTALGDGIHQSQYGHRKYCEWISGYLLDTYKDEDDFVVQTGESEPEESFGQSTASAESEQDKPGSTALLYTGICIIAVLLIAAAIFVIMKKRS